MESEILRHGDILLKRISKIPANAVKVEGKVIAEGEVTGHSHQLIGNATLFEVDEIMYVESQGCELIHQEHDTLHILGNFIVGREREYDILTEEVRQVID